jgi:DNA-binding response OmpR family regulator
MLLERQKHEVQTAPSAAKALEIAPVFCPHIIVSDIGMPSMNGYDLMLNLRSAYGSPFRAIAMTGFGTDADKKKALESGFDECLTKPVEFSLLFRTIEELGRPIVLNELKHGPPGLDTSPATSPMVRNTHEEQV